MQRTGLTFKWETGSKSDNAIKIFREHGIAYQHLIYFELEADFCGVGVFQKVDYDALGNDIFEILVK